MHVPHGLPLVLASAALGACSQQAEEPPPAPSPTQARQPLATDGRPLAAGEWLVEETAGSASARFRQQDGADALVLVCDRLNRALNLSRTGSTTQPQRFRITIGAQKADVMMSPGGALGLTAQVDGTQPIFSAFADPAAVINLPGPGAAALRLPGHPGIGGVLAACA